MKKIVVILISLIMIFAMSAKTSALVNDIPLDARTLNAVLDDFRAAIKNGDCYVSLSEYGLDKDTLYAGLYRLFAMNIAESAAFKFGKFKESYIGYVIETHGSTISGVKLSYDEKYVDSNGKFDTVTLEADKKLVSERYRKAASVVKKGMTDLEKALALYDYVLTITNYPDPISVHGSDVYAKASYKAYGLLRDSSSTCMGFSKLYAILLNESGIPAITLGSETIKHEWVMACIDGEWYHCDPTWDDFYSDEGYTAFLSLNDDKFDIGAMTHRYFLKSDEEFIELGHPDWEVTSTVNPDFLVEPPVSGESGKFDDKFFSNNNYNYTCFSSMSYINGNWYFADIDSRSVVRTTMDGEPEFLRLPDEKETPMYSFAYGNELYVSTLHAVYRLDPISDRFEKIFDTMTDYETEKAENKYYRYNEMCIANDELTLTTLRFSINNDEDAEDHLLDIVFDTQKYPMSEVQTLTALSTVVPTSSASREDPSESTDTRVSKPSPVINQDNEANELAERIRTQSYTYIFIGAGVLILAAAGVTAALIIHKKR